MNVVKEALLTVLRIENNPCEPRKAIEAAARATQVDPWEVRSIIWHLLAAGELELTWDRKLSLPTR